jgi:hypothetical protein
MGLRKTLTMARGWNLTAGLWRGRDVRGGKLFVSCFLNDIANRRIVGRTSDFESEKDPVPGWSSTN